MADEEFKYDPEAGEDNKKLRLPFALCKAKGIEIKDWWTPRDAWNALRNRGEVQDVSEEYADFYRKLKKKRAAEYRKRHPERVKKTQERSAAKKRQLADPEHNFDKTYQHKQGYVAGAKKGSPMDFKQADSGNCNPYFRTQDEKGIERIGYKTNCQTCVATYVARRQGYDVRALPNLNNVNVYQLSFNTALAYKDKDGNLPKQNVIPYGKKDDRVNWLSEQIQPGEIHSVQFTWKGGSSGHIICAEKDMQGNMFLYDPQTNIKYEDGKSMRKLLGRTRDLKEMNLTNCTINEEFCDSIMKKR